jgi:DNA-binding IclR family transcriptional regulator
MPEEPVKKEEKNQYILSSVDNTLKVLDFLGVRDNIGITEICRGCNLDKTSVFKILYTLERKNYVFKTANSKYRLGIKFMNYGDLVAQRQDLIEIATPYMQMLCQRVEESVQLGSLNTTGRVVILHKEKPNRSGISDTRIGFELDAYTNSLGKSLLAFLHAPILQGIVEQFKFRLHTPNTITSAETLYAVLDKIREQGYAQDVDEHYVGYSSVSAPIFNAARQCMAGVGVVCATDILLEKKAQFVAELLTITQEISRTMGYLSGESN